MNAGCSYKELPASSKQPNLDPELYFNNLRQQLGLDANLVMLERACRQDMEHLNFQLYSDSHVLEACGGMMCGLTV